MHARLATCPQELRRQLALPRARQLGQQLGSVLDPEASRVLLREVLF